MMWGSCVTRLERNCRGIDFDFSVAYFSDLSDHE